MIHKAKDLSQDQKMAIESLLGREVAENEAISVRAVPLDDVDTLAAATSDSAPDWLQDSWKSAKQLGLDRLSMEEIDAEIKAARRDRRDRPVEQ